MASCEDEPPGTVLSYRDAGAARDSDDPPVNPWLVTSWSAFVAVLLTVMGGAIWVARPSRTDPYADGLWYAVVVFIIGVLSIVCLLGTVITLILNPRRRRDTALALIPWTLAILTAAAPMALALFR